MMILGAQQPKQWEGETRGEERAEKIEDAPPDIVRQPAEQRNGYHLDQCGDKDRIQQQCSRQIELAGCVHHDENGEDIDPGHLRYFQAHGHEETARTSNDCLEEWIF
jgi:hypothetical protein